MRFQNALLYWVGVSALLASGCALDSGSEAPASVEHSEVTVLADIQLENGHRIKFVETMPGAVSLSETGLAKGQGALLRKLSKLSLHEKYVALGVPIEPATFDKLQAAQERVDALNAEVEKLEAQGLGPKVEAPAGQADEVASKSQALYGEIRNGTSLGYDVPQIYQNWWCDSEVQLCRFYQATWDTGWPGNVTFFDSMVMNLGPGTVIHNHVQYVCLTNIWPIGCVSRGWRTVDSQSVPVTDYGYYSDTYKWTRYSASIPSGTVIHASSLWMF